MTSRLTSTLLQEIKLVKGYTEYLYTILKENITHLSIGINVRFAATMADVGDGLL